MAKVNTKIKEDVLLRIEETLKKRREIAGRKLDIWRKKNANILKNWKGVEIIRFFRERR